MARKKPTDYDDDDGRTIVPMNVDGMPWYTGGFKAPEEEGRANEPAPERSPMSREERRGYIVAAVAAALLIGAVFFIAYALFLLFCRYVWLK